jgi:hypothetical protein
LLFKEKKVSSISEITIKNIDHLGIVAGLVDEIGIVETIDEKLGKDKREKLSAGPVVKAILLNGLGFSKTYMTRVEGENTRLRHYLARLKRKTLCYSKSTQMLEHSIRLLIHYLKFGRVPIPESIDSHDLKRRVPLDRQIIP